MVIIMKTKKNKNISIILLTSLFVISIILNIISWKSVSFCNWYKNNVFPIWTNTFGRLTSILPFSFGEILIWIAVIGLPLSLIVLIFLLIFKKDKRRKIVKVYAHTYLWIIAFILVTETLNCFILYHCSTFAKQNNIPEETHSSSQLVSLADYLIKETNELSMKVQRDEKGQFILTTDLNETAKSAMQNLGNEFPPLAGYYVKPKKVMYSYFMSQQYLMGIYFPFTMEANYNKEMYPLNLPDTVCHELAHTKGYIQEDEASFIAFLACANSDDVEYQYSGYVNALKYVLGKVRDNCDDETIEKVYSSINHDIVVDINANSDYWQSVQESDEGIISSKTVADISDKAMEASLKLNGVEDGKQSYGRMVDLLLNYVNTEE